MKSMYHFFHSLFISRSDWDYVIGAMYLAVIAIPGLELFVKIVAALTGIALLIKAYLGAKTQKKLNHNANLEREKLLEELKLIRHKNKVYEHEESKESSKTN